jgi:hypothetical protein
VHDDITGHLVESIKTMLVVEPLLGRLREIALHSDHDGLGRIADNTSDAPGFQPISMLKSMKRQY